MSNSYNQIKEIKELLEEDKRMVTDLKKKNNKEKIHLSLTLA